MSIHAAKVKEALRHLTTSDPVMRRLVSDVGPFRMKLHRDRFRTLVRAIISQQISSRAADSIGRRLESLAGSGGITAERLAKLTHDELRSAGVSPQKSGYLSDLATKVVERELRLERIGLRSDAEIIEHLTQVKGIGVWTAQMFLMFCLGRLDVLPHDDLGIRNAVRKLYGLRELPDKNAVHRIAEPWRPFATVACWYCWRSLEFDRNGEAGKSERTTAQN